MRKGLITAAALVAAVVVLVGLTLPPAPLRTSGAPTPDMQRRTLAGAFHVHTTRSDGAADRAAVAAAAGRAGLSFVIFTDHGDGTAPPAPPAYLGGVLCIDGVEISTNAGHYVALGVPAAPYRLGGEGADVAADVRRLGGFGVIAHPDSPKGALAWHDWSVEADGLEWLNADSEWRDESRIRLGVSMLDYFVRPGPTLAALLDRPEQTIRRWTSLTRSRRIVALPGHDAHGGLGGVVEEGRRGPSGLPSYEASFRTLSLRVLTVAPLTRDPAQDAALVLGAIRSGRAFTVLDAVAAPAWLDFRGERAGKEVAMGEEASGQGPVRFEVSAPSVPGSRIVLLREGKEIASSTGGSLRTDAAEPGAYWVEVRVRPDDRAPWILGNPIYVDLPAAPQPAARAEPIELASLPGAGWRIEKSPQSEAALTDGPSMTYRLQGNKEDSPFAALVASLPDPAIEFDGVSIDLAASGPGRVSVQLRSGDGHRWRKSVYVSETATRTIVPVAELLPAEQGTTARASAGAARSLLLVIDQTNTVPGASGTLTVRAASLVRLR